MGRPEGTKNITRSPEEKETIVLESFQKGRRKTAEKYGVSGNACSHTSDGNDD